jgi:hypothetical protein
VRDPFKVGLSGNGRATEVTGRGSSGVGRGGGAADGIWGAQGQLEAALVLHQVMVDEAQDCIAIRARLSCLDRGMGA